MLNLRLPPHAGKPAAASAGRSGPHRDRRDGHRVLPGLTIPCVNDIIAYKFNISLNAMMWIGRIGMVLLPPDRVLRHLPVLPGSAAQRP
ncbi:hypothetical protein AS032_29545 [Rhodococcus qingshengii]|nr:hypothetical protein AOT96_31325 [Rhodococcus sp. 008]KLN70188.1 hypothetical protein ABM90_18455 [Rhodococcus erythropolis]KSU69074.1 hypothetical protein AS032_29545 [Rhodococcus qingshengii]KZF15962.1 hypothetical protein A2J01_30120 [Rhodococcus sp. EPR-134]